MIVSTCNLERVRPGPAPIKLNETHELNMIRVNCGMLHYAAMRQRVSIAAWGSTSSGSVTDQPSGAPPSIAARALMSLLCEGFEKTMTRRRARRWVGSAPREARMLHYVL
jgi:alpha-tubulin suppressor-like RCC1 family protein